MLLIIKCAVHVSLYNSQQQFRWPLCCVAGYTGFIPESDHNALACYEASAVDQPRRDGEASTMLFTLDQYSRRRVPLCTSHRPTALSNLSVIEPAHGPSLQTTQVSSCTHALVLLPMLVHCCSQNHHQPLPYLDWPKVYFVSEWDDAFGKIRAGV